MWIKFADQLVNMNKVIRIFLVDRNNSYESRIRLVIYETADRIEMVDEFHITEQERDARYDELCALLTRDPFLACGRGIPFSTNQYNIARPFKMERSNE